MEYDARSIQVLTSVQAIRKRPAMYLGELGSGAFTVLIENVLCAAVDDALAGDCKRIDVSIDSTGVIMVRDDGPGMPVEPNPRDGVPIAQILLTQLHGCRAARRNADAAKRFCSAGIVVTNALAAWLELDIQRSGQRYAQHYQRGEPTGPLLCTGPTSGQGTTIRFLPDPEVLSGFSPDLEAIRRTLAEIQAMAGDISVALHA